MKIEENKSNVIFYPDGFEIKNNNNDSDRIRLGEMANLVKAFGDSAHNDSRFSKASYLENFSGNYGSFFGSSEIEKKRRKNRKHYSNKKISRAALKISIISLSISISTLIALAIERIKK